MPMSFKVAVSALVAAVAIVLGLGTASPQDGVGIAAPASSVKVGDDPTNIIWD